MPLTDIMQEIEELCFAAELNLAPGTKAFRRSLRNHHLFQGLLDFARSGQAQQTIARRVEDLAGMRIDERYENRYDVALATYLTALGDTARPELVAKTATSAAKALNIWWTVSISRELITGAMATGAAEAQPSTHVIPQTAWQRAGSLEDWRNLLANLDGVTSVSEESAQRILTALQTAGEEAQAPGNVIVMPAANEEERPMVWKARRRRARSTAPHTPRPRLSAQVR